MSIVAGELKCYGSASMPEADTGTSGGAIDATCKIEFTDLSANDRVSVQSDGADTRTVTVYGRLASGAIDSEGIVLNGVTWVDEAKTFERILKVTTTSNASRTVTVAKYAAGGHTPALLTIDPLIIAVRRLFYDAASEAGATTRYEKVFWKNTNGTLTLNAAKVTMTNAASSHLTMTLETTKNGSESTANRKTAPSAIGSWVAQDVDVAIQGNTLESASVVGTWFKLSLGASEAAFKSAFASKLSGTTV